MTESMKDRELGLRICTLIGLGLSCFLLVEYLSPTHVLCREGGGCDLVRLSSYSHIVGVPIPILGLLFFAGLAALSMSSAPWTRRAMLLGSVLGGIMGLGFFALQALVIGAMCWFFCSFFLLISVQVY